MVGMGRPSAMQYKNTLVPTLTVCGEYGGSIVTLGASVETLHLNSLHATVPEQL